VLLPEHPEPYGTTEELLQRIREHARRYLVLPAEMEEVVYYYILLTWVFDRFDEAPYLRLIGDIGVGKSRALKIIGELCYRPFIAYGGASMSSIFRSLEILDGATVVLDELDLVKKRDDHQDLMQMLRVGFQRPGMVLRSAKIDSDYGPKAFDVFGPKVLAGRSAFPDPALESRCVRVYMQSGVDLSKVMRRLPESYPTDCASLRNQLLQWRADHYWQPLREVDMPSVEPRLEQLFRPLASLIDDETALEALKSCITSLQEELTDSRRISPEGRVAAALLKLSRDRENSEGTEKKIHLQEVVDALRADGYEIQNRKVGTICSGFGLTKVRDTQSTPSTPTILDSAALPSNCANSSRFAELWVTERWTPILGQFGGFAKVDSPLFRHAASRS
jgi:hypothetical protein